MPRYRVLPYRQGSRSARALADALGGRVLRLEGSRFRPRPDDVIVNWGNTTIFTNLPETINFAPLIRTASNKLHFFMKMREQGLEDIIPEFWTNQGDIPDDAFPIVCRTILAGHSGTGIVISDSRDDLVAAPLYVKYVKKQEEYRVHVGNKLVGNIHGENVYENVAFSVQRKARRQDTPDEEVNWQIRNHANGFNFVRGGVNPPEAVLTAARQSLQASGLDFGAVDVIWNARQERAYVLEINTAPGLEGQTIEDYANFFRV